MLETGTRNADNAAAAAGLSGSGKVFWNLAAPTLHERAIARGEARLSATGALAVDFPLDPAAAIARHLVGEADIARPEGVAPLSADAFAALKDDVLAHAAGRTLFAQDLHAGSGAARPVRVRVFTEHAWQALALRNLLVVPPREEIEGFAPELTLFCLPHFKADPERHGLAEGAAVVHAPQEQLVLVAGTSDVGVAGEALFGALADLLAAEGTLVLRGAATVGADGEVALFLGAPAGGKTALALDPAFDAGRSLLADGALGWNEHGVFALEGGLRAHARDLAEAPALGACAERFGALVENVPLDADSREADFAGAPAGARALLPRAALAGVMAEGGARAPRALFLVGADPLGVLPPIARLTPARALYHLLSGYGADDPAAAEPRPAFAPGYGAPTRDTAALGARLRALLAVQDVDCWLVNTGWTGGPAGKGRRIPLDVSRRLVAAALDGSLARAEFQDDPLFGFEVPVAVEGVEDTLLDPPRAFPNRMDHAMAARRLVGLFAENFARFEQAVDPELRDAQPRLALAAE